MEKTLPLFAVMLKTNLTPEKNSIIDADLEIKLSEQIHSMTEPFMSFLKQKNVNVKFFTSGLHTNGKSKCPHIHAHYICEMNTDASGVPYKMLANVLTNYKYYYSKSWGETNKQRHFKLFPHSVRVSQESIARQFLQSNTDIENVLAYPYKEIIDETKLWKAGDHQIIPEWTTQVGLMTRGAGIYLESIRKNIKIEKTEKTKMEKWGEFCLFMDNLRKTPTKHQMDTLRGVCIVALEYHRERSERTSVNAVITMCKDYAFKRNIWTNNEILDKYNII